MPQSFGGDRAPKKNPLRPLYARPSRSAECLAARDDAGTSHSAPGGAPLAREHNARCAGLDRHMTWSAQVHGLRADRTRRQVHSSCAALQI